LPKFRYNRCFFSISVGDEEETSEFRDLIRDGGDNLDHKDDLVHAMSTCHSLTVIEDKLSGDPIDLKMFEFTNWSLEEANGYWQTIVAPPTDNKKKSSPEPSLVQSADHDQVMTSDDDINAIGDEIGIVKQFQFSSDNQSMAVIVRGLSGKNFTIFCKGSPEKMKMISDPKSIPANFHSILDMYAESGYRVIAVGVRHLPTNFKLTKVERLERHEVEKDLIFLGLIVFENRIKTETKPVIEELHRANMRTIMVTGDHIQTALSVAKECKMISSSCRVIIVEAEIEDDKPGFQCVPMNTVQPLTIGNNSEKNAAIINMDYTFATDGKSFNVIRDHFPDMFELLCTRGTVFARMTPDQKEFLIEELQELGYYVGMCGDGANDCGALKAAHAGISLSDAEASVASPFTSKEQNISCVPELIREGRAALVTSFGIFKYMSAYSLTQFASIILLYDFGTNLSDLQYLYIDLFIITTFAFFFGLTGAYEGELAKRPPNNSLIHVIPIMSLLLQLMAIVPIQVASLYWIKDQDWFIEFDNTNAGYANTTAEAAFNASTIEPDEVFIIRYFYLRASALLFHLAPLRVSPCGRLC
jgi:cation-transporting ATPase 13A2